MTHVDRLAQIHLHGAAGRCMGSVEAMFEAVASDLNALGGGDENAGRGTR